MNSNYVNSFIPFQNDSAILLEPEPYSKEIINAPDFGVAPGGAALVPVTDLMYTLEGTALIPINSEPEASHILYTEGDSYSLLNLDETPPKTIIPDNSQDIPRQTMTPPTAAPTAAPEPEASFQFEDVTMETPNLVQKKKPMWEKNENDPRFTPEQRRNIIKAKRSRAYRQQRGMNI